MICFVKMRRAALKSHDHHRQSSVSVACQELGEEDKLIEERWGHFESFRDIEGMNERYTAACMSCRILMSRLHPVCEFSHAVPVVHHGMSSNEGRTRHGAKSEMYSCGLKRNHEHINY